MYEVKVPGRRVVCQGDTRAQAFLSAMRETFWCHVVLRVFPEARR